MTHINMVNAVMTCFSIKMFWFGLILIVAFDFNFDPFNQAFSPLQSAIIIKPY